jgi:predicted nucleic acid-binding protein
MQSFFDTSAVIPLLLDEPNSQAALNAWDQTETAWAWRWMQVEAEAALARRNANSWQWRQWRELIQYFHWVEMDPSDWVHLCNFNRALKLRSADAGHLFMNDRLVMSIPSLVLITFDKEMATAASTLGITLYE